MVLTIFLVHVQLYVELLHVKEGAEILNLNSQKGVKSRPTAVLLAVSLILFTFTSIYWVATMVIDGKQYRNLLIGTRGDTLEERIYKANTSNDGLRIVLDTFSSFSVRFCSRSLAKLNR